MATQLSTAPALKLLSTISAVGAIVFFVSWLSAGDETAVIDRNDEKTESELPTKKKVKAEEAAKSQQADDIKQLFARFQGLENGSKATAEALKSLSIALEEIKQSNSNGRTAQDVAAMVQQELDKQLGILATSDKTSMQVNSDTETAISEGDAYISGSVESEKPETEKGQGFNLGGYVVDRGVKEESTTANSEERIEWILPADMASTEPDASGAFGGVFDKAQNSLDFSSTSTPKKTRSAEKEDLKPIAYATIDKDAILYNATVLNELIGVVATGDTVQNPFNFKLEISSENLATSGVYLPDVAMLRMSGFVRGEWAAECVEAKITGATFVFNDGTISTISVGDVGKDVGGTGAYLGYLSTIHGSPCIKGKTYSNLAEFASITGGLAAIGAAGDAAASAQYSVSKDASNVLQTFDGNLASNAVGQGLSAGTNSINQVIAGRYANVRDLVVAPSGQYVVMLSKQLNIDYDPEGRRLINENFESDLESYHAKKAAAEAN